MNTNSTPPSDDCLWRLAFMLALALPFVPDFVIIITSLIADGAGCRVDAGKACIFGPITASAIIHRSLDMAILLGVAFGYGGAVIWLALCDLLIHRGWSHFLGRVSLALSAAVLFAFGPYLGPLLAITNLGNGYCRPNEGGVGPCVIFGGDVGNAAHDAVTLPWITFIGAPLALGVFAIYLLLLIALHLASRKQAASLL